MDIDFKLIPCQIILLILYILFILIVKVLLLKDIIKNFLHKGFLLKYLKEVKFISNGKQFNEMNDQITTDNTNFAIESLLIMNK